MAYIAYHFHWPKGEIMEMTASERRRWIDSIAGLNTEIAQTTKASFTERLAVIERRRQEEGGVHGYDQ